VAIGRVYDVSPGIGTGVLIGSTNPANEYTLAVGITTTEYNISAIRVAMVSGVSASYPANGTITFRIRKPANAVTFTTGVQGSTGVIAPIGQSTTIANSTWTYSTLANATGTCSAYGNIVWEQTLPLTAGANWGEWFTPGFEINANPAQATLLLTYEAGANSISTAANVGFGLVVSE
jgi:hypothetical protein